MTQLWNAAVCQAEAQRSHLRAVHMRADKIDEAMAGNLEKVVPRDAALIIANGGSHYGSHHTAAYERSLMTTARLFTKLRSRRAEPSSLMQFWLQLPPTLHGAQQNASWGWSVWPRRNERARELLPRWVVHIGYDSVIPRLSEDPKVKSDGVHWCGTAASAIPTHLVQLILHIATLPVAMQGGAKD